MIDTLRAAGRSIRVSEELLSHDGTVIVSEQQAVNPDGSGALSLLVLTPVGLAAPAPAIYHLHGGGMIMGDNRTGIEVPLTWARELGAVLVCPEYRLAPEHPDPTPLHDCYFGLEWTHAHASELGVDPDQILLSGASGGGGLAAGVALLARDQDGPPLIGQILMAPMLDDRAETPSSTELVGGSVWDSISNETGWTALLGNRRGGPQVSPYAAPARATDLSGLPPAYIDVGSVEVFRDEDVEYAARIWRAGGQAELHVWPGAFHGFDVIAPRTTISQTAAASRARWVARQLNRQKAPRPETTEPN